jgi:hypothetical protein
MPVVAFQSSSRLVLVALGLALLARPAAAGRIPEAPRPGDRVRLLLYDERPVTGRLGGFDSRSLELLAGPDSLPRVVPRISIAVLERQVPDSRRGRGTVLGFVAGGLGGMAVNAAIAPDDDAGMAPARAFIVGSLVGALAGAVVGGRHRQDRWREAPLP